MNYNLTVQAAKDLITAKLSHNMGVAVKDATNEHFYKATALVLRDLMSEGYREFSQKVSEQKKKTVYYLCMEFLLGRSLKNNICNLNLEDTFGQALKSFGTSLDKIYEQEPDAGLGNGGLGRLAACFLDGLASQGYSSIGYSLRYEMGIFRQSLVDGWQTELPDNWLPGGSVWLQSHPDKSIKVYFNGTVEETWGDGKCTVKLKNATAVTAVPHDMYISGNDGKGISRLRLWAAKAEQIDMNLFNEGQHMRAMEQKAMAESITQILYPGDSHTEGKSLRLNQQYFVLSNP
ncbi:MAG: glycogen/starch/alpha-glucan phosphorylase [Clostridia bacterium]|nr:glycogen/starch/alpha-glucan phosphorylase [Clostridia bacterium]